MDAKALTDYINSSSYKAAKERYRVDRIKFLDQKIDTLKKAFSKEEMSRAGSCRIIYANNLNAFREHIADIKQNAEDLQLTLEDRNFIYRLNNIFDIFNELSALESSHQLEDFEIDITAAFISNSILNTLDKYPSISGFDRDEISSMKLVQLVEVMYHVTKAADRLNEEINQERDDDGNIIYY